MDQYTEFLDEKITKNGNKVRNQGKLMIVAGSISWK